MSIFSSLNRSIWKVLKHRATKMIFEIVGWFICWTSDEIQNLISNSNFSLTSRRARISQFQKHFHLHCIDPDYGQNISATQKKIFRNFRKKNLVRLLHIMTCRRKGFPTKISVHCNYGWHRHYTKHLQKQQQQKNK